MPNRVVISPMLQYSAVEGEMTDWHLIHLGHLALSGAGLLVVEATAVEPIGRVSRECIGLYSDLCEAAFARILEVLRRYSRMPIGIQLAHSGRKGSLRKPIDGRGALKRSEGGWTTVAPSALPFGETWPIPDELDRPGMKRIILAFKAAARRCARLGFDLLEIHAAHGYLLSSFLSPIANVRRDAYGGSLENRMRFPLEVFGAVREVWPAEKPLGVRLNGTDWNPAGVTPEEAVRFAAELHERGCDFADVSSGGNGYADIPVGPGYQVPFAERVRSGAGIPTIAVGLIRDPAHAEAIVAGGSADMVAIGRGMLNDPRWPWHAAEDLGAAIDCPEPYLRAVTRAGVSSPHILACAAAPSI